METGCSADSESEIHLNLPVTTLDATHEDEDTDLKGCGDCSDEPSVNGRRICSANASESEKRWDSVAIDIAEKSEREDTSNLTYMLHTLKDCIWCMNLFMNERLNIKESQTRILCCTTGLPKNQKHPYTEDDIKKELNYIDHMLNLSVKVMISIIGKNKEYCILADGPQNTNSLTLKTLIYNGKMNLFSEIIRRYNEKAIQINALVKDGSTETNSKKNFQNNKNVLNDFFWKINNEVNSINSMLSEFGEELFSPTLSDGRVFLERDIDWYTNFITEINKCTKLLGVLVPQMGEEFRAIVQENDCDSDEISLEIPELSDPEAHEEISESVKIINKKSILTNELLKLTCKDDALRKEMAKTTESILHHNDDVKCKMRQMKRTEDVPSMPFLLFRKERWRMEVLRRNREDPLNHISGLAYPIPYDSFKNDTCSTFYGIKKKNLLGISLQTVEFTENPFKSTKRKAGKFIWLIVTIFLYVGDFISDLILAREHYQNGNHTYGSLTLLFVFAPLMAETTSKLILKALGKDKEYVELKWKDIFTLNDLKIFKRMVRSTQYAINSMRNYSEVAAFYSELHSHRCNKGKKHFQRETAKSDSSHIQAVFLAMQTWNERFILQTKITEVLNESAPQLLLQLTIATRESLEHNDISFEIWASIAFSIFSLSWTMHQAHYNRHYNTGGRVLDNAYTVKSKLVEFLGNIFVYCSRVLSICSFTAVYHVWFFIGAFFYLLLLYFSLIFASERKKMYKGLHRYKSTIFWPLHRMFTIPYRIGLWRMDSIDHLLFYLETLILAFTLPFVLHDRLDFNLACAISGAILLCEVCGIVLMVIFRKYVHPDGYVCQSLM